jgi:hypothetical protein
MWGSSLWRLPFRRIQSKIKGIVLNGINATLDIDALPVLNSCQLALFLIEFLFNPLHQLRIGLPFPFDLTV